VTTTPASPAASQQAAVDAALLILERMGLSPDDLAAALSVPADVVYGTGRIDTSGRVADQAITCALGWREGDRLTLTAEPGVVTARRDPRGMVSVPPRGCLAIPAVLRRRCGLRAGDRVLLAAVPGQDTLAAYSFAVVDQAIRAHGVFPHAPGGQP